MSSQLLIESFPYGNIKLFLKHDKINYQDNDTLDCIITSIVESSRYWNDLSFPLSIIWNLQNNIDHYSINFFKFVKRIFDIFDNFFETDYTKVSFDNIITLKAFLLNDINYIVDAYSISPNPIGSDILFYYTTAFKKDLEYIRDLGVITQYNLPSEENWIPRWTVNYNQNIIHTSLVDIQLDNFISNPSIVYASNMVDILGKILTRLTFLKENCKNYFVELNKYMKDFSLYVFNNYPYYEIAKHYEGLMKISNNVHIPDGTTKESFTGIGAFLSIIPTDLASYILGFPAISMGYLSPRLVAKYTQALMIDKDKYFEELILKNDKTIKSAMMFDKCANGVDNGNIINLLYNSVKSYNTDDITIVMSNDVYFIFTYPEYDNIWKNDINPYNREFVTDTCTSRIKMQLDGKRKIMNVCRLRGLELELNGTLEENFDELVKKITIYKPPIYQREVMFDRNSIINSVLNNLVTGSF